MSVIFISGLIEKRFNETKGYSGYYAKRDIKRGTLLLIEQLITSTNPTHLINFLFLHPELSDEMHPIKKTKSEDCLSACVQKYEAGVYKMRNFFVVTVQGSLFTHSCSDNNANPSFGSDTDDNYCPKVMEIYAIKDIKQDTEITITWDFQFGHEKKNPHAAMPLGYPCNCNKSYKVRKDRFERSRKQNEEFTVKQSMATQVLRKHMKQNLLTIFKLYLVEKGLIVLDKELFYIFPDNAKTGKIPYDVSEKTGKCVLRNFPDPEKIKSLFENEKKEYIHYVRVTRPELAMSHKEIEEQLQIFLDQIKHF